MADHGFKAKSIRKILSKKLDDWIKSIDDPILRGQLKKNIIVTGGSITSMLMGDEVKDFDIYFKDFSTTKAVAEYYCNKFLALNPNYHGPKPEVKITEDGKRVEIRVQSYGAAEADDADETPEGQYEDSLGEGGADSIVDSIFKPQATEEARKEHYRPVFLSQNAITLTDKVQLVIRFYGSPEEIHKNYDFEHCKNVYDYFNDQLYLNPKALECILSKTLHYTGSLYPICSLFRMRKFIERGWRISAGEILKMAFQVNALNLNDNVVLTEQLTGCDQAYMRHLILEIKQAKEENAELDIDHTYIVALVDRVFNE